MRNTLSGDNDLNNVGFWLSVVAIIMFGLFGGILFKYGTAKLGTISIQRLLEIEFSRGFWINAGLMLLGLSFFILGGWNLREHSFAMRYLFSPIIFGALILMFMSRVLVGIPLSVTGLGRLSSITASLLILATTIASAVIFKERFDARTILGILMSVAVVALLGGGVSE